MDRELLAAALPEEPKHRLVKRVEKHALKLTWAAWLARQQGRLHPVPDMDLSTEQARRWADEKYGDLFVGVVPPVRLLSSEEFITHQLCRVGIWGYISERQSWINDGPELVLWDFDHGTASSLHRGVGLVGFVHILPLPFQRIAFEAHRIRHSDYWDEEDGYVPNEDYVPLDLDRVA